MNESLPDNETANSAPERRLRPQILIGAVVLLTLIGVLLVPGEAPEEATEISETAEAPSLLTEQAAISGPNADPSADLPQTAAGAGRGPGAQARALIASQRTAGGADLDALHTAAAEAEAAGNLEDAYLLYFFAAREGHAASALALGSQADPAGHDPTNSLFEASDLTQAHKWYQMAARNGSVEARERLADLRTRVTELAADGDAQAQRLALLWQ